ncbi:monovalent cation:proton antiporter-2 (CPA2) family protein [uncultured Rheinheimera sp.]|uniref:monovalent cation:proton antiporter-2 (CPA2) family protein n=1 Tax=uncultured Rheinheimera sp. TaxID=400532 RepID=UPI002596D863|nr:monovalent cation:proton antiporter-2 (CPA2) family protein [uncultured Rheinheimera sp.]
MHLNVLTYLMIYLAAMVLVVPLAKRFGLGVVLGYLLAGVALGPAGFSIASNTDDIKLLAELGVVLMLFSIGLELDAKKLWAMRHRVFLFGSLQVLVCALGIGLATSVLGLSYALSVFIGLALALSSTAVAVQLMKDRNLMGTQTGQSVFGALLLQDMVAIPLLIGISLIAPSADTAEFKALPALAAVVAVIFTGRYLIGYLLHWVAHYGSRELFVGLALLLVIGVMELMTIVGVSAGLGAFIAGVLLASSEFRHQLEADLEPFKGLFLGLFFITIGASINMQLLSTQWPLISLLLLLFVGLKLLLLYGVARVIHIAAPERLSYAVLLGQGSEFGFVLAALATAGALLSATEGAMLNLLIALSVAVSPLLMKALDVWSARQQHTPLQNTNVEASDSPVIIAGFGRYGQIMGRLLLSNGVVPTVLDHDSDTIQTMTKFGFKVYYGDASRMDVLEAAGALHAKILVIAVDDVQAINAIVSSAKQHFPHLILMARAKDVAHIYQLRQLGVDHIERELFEASLRQGRNVLTQLGMGQYEAKELADRFRAANYQLIDKMQLVREQQDEKSYIQLLRQSREELQRQLERESRDAPQRYQGGYSSADHRKNTS